MNAFIGTPAPRRTLVAAAMAAAASLLLIAGTGQIATSSLGSSSQRLAPVAGEAVSSDYGQLPLYFVENQGQAPEALSYVVQGADTSLGFTAEGVNYLFKDGGSVDQAFIHGSAEPTGVAQSGATFSWFSGDRADWVNADSFEAVRYEDVWPGIDVVYSGSSSRLRYRFVVEPGADPSNIQMAYRGSDLSLSPQGDLLVTAGTNSFSDEAPISYQGVGSARQDVTSSFDLSGSRYSINLGSYDKTRPLVIDPATVVYAGFIGGAGTDTASGIAVDLAGNAYVVGQTSSVAADFPETGGPDLTDNGGTDGYIAKVNASGTGLVYAGFIGGSGADISSGVAVDAEGNAYVSGFTTSTAATFPEVGGPDLTDNGGTDGFITKVNASGTGLSYAGFIGGSGSDFARSIAVDASGNAYITGETSSAAATFPEVGGPDLTDNGGTDGFITKVNASGTGLSYAGYIGGSGDENGRGIAVDAAGNAYVTGITSSTAATFPETGGPDLTENGLADVFIAKVNTSGTALSYGGFIGGSLADGAFGVALDAAGNVYLAGIATSTAATFPEIGGPDLTDNGGFDGFIAKIATERPDVQIAVGAGAFRGDGVYNTTGASQAKTVRAVLGKTATFSLKFENDGPLDGFKIAGPAGTAKFKATYFDGGTNITADVVAGNFAINGLAPGGSKVLTMKVKLSTTAVGSLAFIVNGTSQGDPSVSDTVKAVAKVKI